MRESTNRLQGLLDLGVESAALEGNDLGSTIGVVGDGRSALGAEESVDCVSRGGGAGPLLDGTVDGERGLGDDDNESCQRELAFDKTN